MLFYDKMIANLSLDTFERSEISSMLKYVIKKINTTPYMVHSSFRHNIELDSYICHKATYTDKNIQILLRTYNERNDSPLINNFNVFNHHFTRIDASEFCHGICNCGKYRSLRSEIIYKRMKLPLGKIRVKNFKKYI